MDHLFALGLGIFFNSDLPKKKQLWGRRIAQLLIGSYMLVFVGFILRENMQIEGFFYSNGHLVEG